MLPGPTIIRKCSECSGLIEENTIMSGNTCGAKLWTDGKMDAPMLPDSPWLVKCPYCQALIWIYELEVVGNIAAFSDKEAYKDIRSYCLPELQDYFDELKKTSIDKEKEEYIRLHIWWKGNDKRRYNDNTKEKLSEEEIRNLQALEKILDPYDDDSRILIAEIKRELGQFEEAEKLLNKPFDQELSHVVSIIRDLIQKRDPFVAEIKFEN